MNLEPTVLEGAFARLEPLSLGHVEALCEVGFDPDIWTWMSSDVDSPEKMEGFVRQALDAQEAGTAVPFATIERSTGRAVGSTRFGAIDVEHQRAEIGWTWIAPQWHRSGINREAKLLMLTHAFETMGCLRVELKTNANNERSRRAILGIGAVEEGTLRRHMISKGKRRDSVYFSIIVEEWPGVKEKLEESLRRPR
ncbi:MAG: GNAT family protein [Acidobacteriota bacterium]